MSVTKKTVKLGKIKQLIDLNGDSTNFDLSFKVSCHDDTPFKVLVVDQTTLDNTPELQYKETSKTISGNIVSDKNVYQNHFLVLKADNECTVDIELTKKILPKTPDTEMGVLPFDMQRDRMRSPQKVSTGDSCISWKKVGLIALVVVIGLVVLWWLYKRKGDTKTNETSQEQFKPLQSNHGADPSERGSKHDRGSQHAYKRGSPSPYDNRVFKPALRTRESPNIMSHSSRQSAGSGDNGNSLLNRLRKFAR